MEVFAGPTAPLEPTIGHRPFFDHDVAIDLLRKLQEDTPGLSAEAGGGKRQPVPHVDMPVSRSLVHVLGLVATARHNDAKAIEPLYLPAVIVEDRDSRLAQLLADHGIATEGQRRARFRHLAAGYL